MRKETIIGAGLIANYSKINQAWIIRSYNKEWSTEAQLFAPVFRIVNSEAEAREIVLGPTKTASSVSWHWTTDSLL